MFPSEVSLIILVIVDCNFSCVFAGRSLGII